MKMIVTDFKERVAQRIAKRLIVNANKPGYEVVCLLGERENHLCDGEKGFREWRELIRTIVKEEWEKELARVPFNGKRVHCWRCGREWL